MNTIHGVEVRGSARLVRGLLSAAESDLGAAFARKDRQAVRRFGDETTRYRTILARLSRRERDLPVAG